MLKSKLLGTIIFGRGFLVEIEKSTFLVESEKSTSTVDFFDRGFFSHPPVGGFLAVDFQTRAVDFDKSGLIFGTPLSRWIFN